VLCEVSLFGDKLRKVHAMRETFDRKIIYLDNAATSWPKPEAVYEAVDHAMRYSGNASRSGHRLALEADRLLYQTRKLLASFSMCRTQHRLCSRRTAPKL